MSKPLALVTGASSGIGYQLGRQFAQHGFDLFIVAEHAEHLVQPAADFSALGADVRSIAADLRHYDEVIRVAQELESTGRTLEAAAINAGIGVGGPFAENDLQRELDIISLNVTSTVHLAKHVVQKMKAQGNGRILFTASVASIMPAPYEAVYGASKAFVLSLSDSLRTELKDDGISVTALMPGPTDTAFFHKAGMDDTKAGAAKKDDPAKVAEQAFEALMRGDDRVLAGSAASKVMGTMGQILPNGLVAEMHAKSAEPGGAKK